MSDWTQYPDTTLRQTYPPLPPRGGNPNKEATDAVTGMVATQHAASVRQEADFRARQRMRRLKTRGAAAMRDPEESLPFLPPPVLEVPDDPALQAYTAAGWLG
jgi:hypothetical protein